MEPHSNDLTSADDMDLVASARAGDRLSFGVLYLRHHAAAWRVACVVSRFSPDAELAVIEGFTRVLSALPRETEEFTAGGVTFRPYLLACVRHAALERARSAGRAAGSPAPLAGLAPDGELLLSSLEHHVARGALAGLPERSRTALWLSDVEAMTPAEIAGMLGGTPEAVSALVAESRNELQVASRAALVGHEVRAECRFTAGHLDEFHAGTLDPAKGVLVRSHLDLCPTCRMRFAELANGPATLAAAVPAAPLLGGEAQHHFLTSLPDVRPADRLLPPGIAAAAPAVAPGHARKVAATAAVASMASVASGLPARARQAGRRVMPVVPVMALVIAWLGVMLSLPQLMEPDTAPGPGGLALPAVQAYVPGYLRAHAEDGSGGSSSAAAPSGDVAAEVAAEVAGAGGGGEEFALRIDNAPPAAEDPIGTAAVELAAARARTSAVNLAAANSGAEQAATGETGGPAVPASPAAPPASAAPAVVPVSPMTVAAAAAPGPSPAADPTAEPAAPEDRGEKPSKDGENSQRRSERNLRRETRPSMPEFARPDVASPRSKAREDSDGRTARREARRRHTDHAQPA